MATPEQIEGIRRELSLIGKSASAALLTISLWLPVLSMRDCLAKIPGSRSEENEAAAKTWAERLHIHVTGVECHGSQCVVVPESGSPIAATCDNSGCVLGAR